MGQQEASRADIGIAGGKEEGLLFKKGQLIRKIPQDQIVESPEGRNFENDLAFRLPQLVSCGSFSIED